MSRAYTISEALAYGHGIERQCLCPVHGDTNPSASVNVLKKKWVCFSCGSGGSLTGEQILVEPSYWQMARQVENKAEAALRVYSEAWLNRYDAGEVHEYWLRRFDEATARHWRLGYDDELDAVTYPLRGSLGEVLGVVKRPLVTDGAKYLYPYGVDISRLIFNYTPDARSAIVLVEGALDAISLWTSGIDAWALYGSRLSERQIELINAVDPMRIYTAFDNDDAGFRAHCAVERAFPQRAVARVQWPLSWGKDVDEIGPEKREKVFADLLKSRLSCVELPSCESPPPSQLSCRTSSKPRMLRIKRTNV